MFDGQESKKIPFLLLISEQYWSFDNQLSWPSRGLACFNVQDIPDDCVVLLAQLLVHLVIINDHHDDDITSKSGPLKYLDCRLILSFHLYPSILQKWKYFFIIEVTCSTVNSYAGQAILSPKPSAWKGSGFDKREKLSSKTQRVPRLKLIFRWKYWLTNTSVVQSHSGCLWTIGAV